MNIFHATEHALDFLHQAMLHSFEFEPGYGAVNQSFNIEQSIPLFHPEEIKIYKV